MGMWLALMLFVAVCHAQTDCSAADPSINTIGKCYKPGDVTGLKAGFWGFSTYHYDTHNYVVNAHLTYDEIWNVDDPFNPDLVENITGLDQCRGPVYTNTEKIGNYIAHFGSYQSYCNCVQGQPCIPFLKYTNGGVVKNLKLCDNPVYPVNTKDVSAPAKLSVPLNGCNSITNDLTGKVAVIQRGDCSFQEKLDNAVAKGAVAVVIVNGAYTAGTGECIDPGAAPVNTPTIMISYDDGLPIITALQNGENVVLSMGPTYYINYNSAQAAPFGGVWGSTQYIRVAHFDAETADDFVLSKNEDLATLYNPYNIIGLNKRPDAESTHFFLVSDQNNAAVARIDDGKFYLVTKTFPVPDTLDFGLSIFFVKGGRYWLASPNFLGDEAVIYALGNIGEGNTPVIERWSSIPQIGNQVALPVPPLNNYIYVNSASFDEEGACPRRYEIWDITFQVSPAFENAFQTQIKDGGGTDQLNDGDFLEAEDGTIIGAVCGTSEGILLFNANDPANPVMSGVFDGSKIESDYQTGAQGCSAGTDGLTWWYQDLNEKAICAVQLAYGPGSAGSGASSIVLNVFVGLIAGFLAMQW